MSELKSIRLEDLELVRTTQENTEMDVSVSFPFSPEFPASTGLELEGGHNVVYFEVPPGKSLETHRDSPEELVICLEGEGIEAWVAEARGEIAAGEMVVVPPLEPHGVRNTGEKKARFVGLFSDSTNVGEFEEAVQPMGTRIIKA